MPISHCFFSKSDGSSRCTAGERPSLLSFLVLLLLLSLLGGQAQAIPSFARQTGLQCSSCHTNYPQLNAFGRAFKMRGYTLQTGSVPFYKRLSAMLEPSFTHTSKDQAGGAAPHFGPNDNLALTQGSIFYGGRLVDDYDKLGAFIQVTYDGIGRKLSWDNTDIRWANADKVAGKDVVWGISLNNNPSVSDLWNTTPAWGFPFSGSGLAPGPAASTLIEGNLAGATVGANLYADWSNAFYTEAGLYKTPGKGFLQAVGVNSVGQEIDGVAPYGRFAFHQSSGASNYEIGVFGLHANTYPGRDHSAGTTDRYTDLGVDAQYQWAEGLQDLTLRGSWIHERQRLKASTVLGNASNVSNHLNTYALSASYLYDQTYGLNLAYNGIKGSRDAALYGGSPNSDYYTIQLDWLPLNKNAGPAGDMDTFNPKISLQYVAYAKMDGSSSNASDNNTLYLQAWLAF